MNPYEAHPEDKQRIDLASYEVDPVGCWLEDNCVSTAAGLASLVVHMDELTANTSG